MIRVAVVGLGKMGLSHLAVVRAHPDVDLVGVCDSTGYILDVLSKYTGAATFSSVDELLRTAKPDAVVIATPSHLHASMVRKALERNIHVFCEKPLFLDPRDNDELTALAAERGLVTQVGYHNKFVGTFGEVKRLLDAGALGTITNVTAEAYGPVVLKPAGRSWRSRRATGGGCLYDYAAHPLDLLTWYLGEPMSVSGSTMTSIFSKDTDDSVTSTLHFPGSVTAQLTANWSDESKRKMTTSVRMWGTAGHLEADRQAVKVYLRGTATVPAEYQKGWNVKYTTELTEGTWFYLRGEEYSAQIDDFIQRVGERRLDGLSTFATASMTDRVIAMIAADAEPVPKSSAVPARSAPTPVDRGARPPRRQNRVSELRRRVVGGMKRRTAEGFAQ
jgi:scyllo-inositol 2-dehydrogenase (NADP+)